MKYRQIAAFFYVMVLLITQNSFLVFATNEGENEIPTITLGSDFTESLTVLKVYDGNLITNMEFPDVDLIGIQEDDEVYLAASAKFNNKDVGENKVVKLTDFHLTGESAYKYNLELPYENFDVTLLGSITPKTIHLIPDESENNYTSEKYPKELKYQINENDIIPGDTAHITAKVYIKQEDDGYVYALSEDATTDNSNYVVGLSDSVTPKVIKPDVPIINKAVVTIDRTDEKNKLNYYDFGIVANNSVMVSVTAIAKQGHLPVTFTLFEEEKQVGDSVTVDECETVTDQENNTVYEFIANFEIKLSDISESRVIEKLTCKVDNGSSSEKVLELKSEDSEKITQTLILDKEPPVIVDNSLKVIYDNENKNITVTGKLEDKISGIESVEYKWDEKTEYINYEIFDPDSKNSTLDMSFTTDYESDELGSADNGKHILYLKITDHAGNVYETDGDTYSLDCEVGMDTKPPVVKDIKFSTEGADSLDKVITILSFSNYINDSIELKINVEDESEGKSKREVKSVILLDGDTEEKLRIEPESISGNEYTFKLTYKNLRISEFNIKMTDIYGNKSIVSVSDILKKSKTTEDIDWSKLESNIWIFDTDAPKIDAEYEYEIIDDNNLHYFNKDGGKIKVTISDNDLDDRDLADIIIIRTYQAPNSEEISSEQVVLKESFSNNQQKKYEYVIDTSNTLFETGIYRYTVTAYDYAGNKKDYLVEFYVEHEDPTGNITVISPDIKSINGQKWIKEKDDNGNIQPIIFRLYPETTGSKLNKFKFTVNDIVFNFTSDNIMLDAEGKAYVDLTINKNEVSYIDNTYYINTEIITVAGNTGYAVYELHIDTENPEIEKFTVQRKNSPIEDLVNVLTFGVFCKDSITLTVNAFDGENDVGLEKLMITYKDNNEIQKEQTIYFNGETECSWDIELSEDVKIFQSSIEVTVYDKLGKHSLELPNISNVGTDGNVSDTHFVMIETIPPNVTVTLPNSDGVQRKDNQVWYNSDKNIDVFVDDSNSGIREVKFSVNGKEFQKDNAESVIATSETTKNKITKELQYVFSTEAISKMVEANDDGSYHIECQAVDNAGNVSNIERKVFYIDVTEPTIKQFSFEPVTVDGDENTSDFITQLKYGFYFQKEANVIVTIDDTNDGNIPSSGLNKVTFRLVSYDGKIKNETVNEVAVSDNKAKCLIPTGFKGQIYASADDKVGNVSDEKTSYGLVVDNSAPTISIAPLPNNQSKTDDNGNKLYTETVKFKVTVSDTKSGLREISYSKSSDLNSFKDVVTKIQNTVEYNINDDLGNGWKIAKTDSNLVTEVSQIFTFEKDDKNIFMTFNATDNSKNNSGIKESEKFTIDTVSPTVKKFNFEPATADGVSETESFIEELEYGFYFKKEFNAVVSVDDNTPSSGLDKVVFRLVSYNNGEIVSETRSDINVKNKKAVCRIPTGFKGQIYVQAYDRAVNKSDEKTPQAFVVDDTAPVITIEKLPDNNSKKDMDGNKLYTETVQFRVTISDEKSGLREIAYSKSSEKDSFSDVVTTINNTSGYHENDSVDNGWQVTETDKNLITEVSQVFTFSADDNNIVMSFYATDRSQNTSAIKKSESFTIDTVSPRVVILNSTEPINGKYYKDTTTYIITITERNFDENRMVSEITNTFTSAKPTVNFVTNSSDATIHTATVTFPEGDYEFSFSGEDCGGHSAKIYVNENDESINYFHTSFNVDATAPQINTNFSEFGSIDDNQIYFNSSKTAIIEIIEHNFEANDMGITVESKSSGTTHSSDSEGWYEIGSKSDWKHDGDKHTLEILFDNDAIYRITVAPIDLAGNETQAEHSAIYEIDTIAPELYSRNDKLASEKDFVTSPYYEIYDEKKKDSPAPTVKFEDLNFDRIEVEAVVYRPEYKNGMELGEIVIDSLSKELSVPVNSKEFSLSKFEKDGVYSITYVAVDKAGNKSNPINDTYLRMIDTDVLAYIYHSSINDRTGYYSLMDEDRKAISKKATDFQDIDIFVIKLKEDDKSGVLVLRENEKKYYPSDYITVTDEDVSETAIISKTHLPASYFSETFKDDGLDTRMYLSISIHDDAYLDLASIHIDNEPPTATLPEDFVSWQNYMFTNETTITLTNISETLDEEACKVYECPREGERIEIPFKYVKNDKTLSFVLEDGLHNIDITLVDEAGNEWNIDRVRYLRVGNFRLYLGIGIGLVLLAAVIGIILWRKNKHNK